MDVDCVIELATYGSLQEFEYLLRRHGFVNDIESGVICRWKYNGETVDIVASYKHAGLKFLPKSVGVLTSLS